MKITLPEKPVDLFEIKWWYVEGHDNIHEGRIVYHADKAWEELNP